MNRRELLKGIVALPVVAALPDAGIGDGVSFFNVSHPVTSNDLTVRLCEESLERLLRTMFLSPEKFRIRPRYMVVNITSEVAGLSGIASVSGALSPAPLLPQPSALPAARTALSAAIQESSHE